MLGEGWFDLADATLAEIERVPTASGADPATTQLKEKFGALRVYSEPVSDPIRAILDDAERRSLAICHTCAKAGGLIVDASNLSGVPPVPR